MSVTMDGEVVRLAGRCGAEEAEALLAALQDAPDRSVDLTEVERLHLALVQILISARPSLAGKPDDAFLSRHVLSLLE